MKAIISKAGTEKRDLSGDENTRFEELHKQAETLTAEIQRGEKIYDLDQRNIGPSLPGRDAINVPGNNATEWRDAQTPRRRLYQPGAANRPPRRT